METGNGVCEIVEVGEGVDTPSRRMLKQKQVHSVEDDIDKLFQAIDIRPVIEETLWKNRMKRPMRASTSQASGIGIYDSSNLKQALRGLCILQASEMAAMKRQSIKSAGLAGAYKAVVTGANESGLPLNEGKGNAVGITLPNEIEHRIPAETSISAEVSRTRLSNQSRNASTSSVTVTKTRMLRAASQDKVMPLPLKFEHKGNLKAKMNSKAVHALAKKSTNDIIAPSKSDALTKLTKQDNFQQDQIKIYEDISLQHKDEFHPEPCASSSCISDPKKLPRSSPHLRKLALKGKSFVMRKEKSKPNLASSASSPSLGNSCCSTSELHCQVNKAPVRMSSANSAENSSSGIYPDVVDSAASQFVKPEVVYNAAKSDMKLQSKEKGEISQSSKSSRGDFSSSTTSISEESSSLSGSSRCGNRPHMSKDLRWDAIRQILKRHGSLCLKHFKLLKRLGSGDIGSVYLAQLLNTDCLFALKVMDNEFLARRKKLSRAETEKEILQMLDHPFLPTLYAHFSTDRLSCLVMEYCPGGDLHVVRQKQPSRIFSEQAARFYAAEVLLAIEYLHMLGVVYRDLKPENILVREDGHIMLSDFDLSLRCAVNPTVLRSTSPVLDSRRTTPCAESSCIDPFCLQPSWEASCFTPTLLLTSASKTRKPKSDNISRLTTFPQLVAEPTDARSNSFVGTHEYLAPEIIKGDGHGSAVDWWTLGIFLYELLYGKTPFKGSSNEETVTNIMTKPLRLPENQIVSFYARDLIRGLLVKEPGNRLGFVKGAVEIKSHPFFEGLNWALIRCAVPPERPQIKKGKLSFPEFDSSENVGFDLF